MPTTKYSRFDPDALDDLSLEELVEKLSEFFLQSGFEDRYGFQSLDDATLEDLKEAILNALLDEGALSEDMLERMQSEVDAEGRTSLDRLLERLAQRLNDEDYIRIDEPAAGVSALDPAVSGPGQAGQPAGRVKFELTNKTVDFLGFKTLRNLLGGLGKSSFGQHETRELATGVEVTGNSKPYEFGDTLNLDVGTTLLAAVRRQGRDLPRLPIDVDYRDLHVQQSEYRSSCATVLLLDCSHSMILYGEDRFTPAKRVAMALAHLVRTHYPGDTLYLVLFHDSAEEVPLSQLARVKVGPFYTNTREGLRLAQRILMREPKDMRQIIMITDGKPSALTLPDGRIYKNPFGLDPMIVEQTFQEVSACRRAGILINTFMLARDASLVSFVKKLTEMVRGKAYFTSPVSLGQYVLLDYLNKKFRTIH
jgi:Ca-activated chloride channel family protein